MNANMTKIVSGIFTVVMTFIYFYIEEEAFFTTWVGIVVIVLYILALYFSIRAIVTYDNRKIEKGKKHREKIISINFFILVMMLLISTLYFVEYFFMTSTFLLWFVIASLIFVFGYFTTSLIFDYVILEEDGFTSNYFLKLKKISIKYDDITKIKFGILMNAFEIKTKDAHVFVDVALINSDAVLNAIYKNTSTEIHKNAFEALGKYFKQLNVIDNMKYLDYFKDKRG